MDAGLWRDILHPDVSILEKIIRPILVYFFLIAGLRLAGKRELAQLNAFDLVVLLTLSNTVQNAIIGNDNSVTGGVIGATTLLLVNYIVVRFLYSHETLDRVIDAYARAVALAGSDPKYKDLKADAMGRLTDWYKFRHNKSDTGLNDMIASILSKPLPPEPTPLTSLPPASTPGSGPNSSLPGSGSSATGTAPTAAKNSTAAPGQPGKSTTAPSPTKTSSPAKPKSRRAHFR